MPTNTILTLGDEIFSELGEPSDISIASICFWLDSNVGKLNNLLATSFGITEGTNNFDSEFGNIEKVIFKQIYFCYYFNKQMVANLGEAAISTTLEWDSDGSRIKKINRNDIAKTYKELKKICQEELREMVINYQNNSQTNVYGVVGADAYYSNYSCNSLNYYNRTIRAWGACGC